MTTKTQICIYPGCSLFGCTRGLCHGHYHGARRMIREKKASEADLATRGLMLPAAQKGLVSLTYRSFHEGRVDTGDAYKGGDEGRAKLEAAAVMAKLEADPAFADFDETEEAKAKEYEEFPDFDDTKETP